MGGRKRTEAHKPLSSIIYPSYRQFSNSKYASVDSAGTKVSYISIKVYIISCVSLNNNARRSLS